ncbi:MAG: 16S rRNA (uracil(1498)-N(3))-methyltransferase [Micrococcales bacterium]|nr:16S rRNA (uracil(1498)-N(3))-methyltransferase [Micrococcales bacterium]
MSAAPVFLTEPGDLDGLAPGEVFWLRGAEARHAAVVQRRGAGERVDVVDTAGVRLVGTVASTAVGTRRATESDAVAVEVVQVCREPVPEPALVLVQALAKGDRDERAVEAATEVGVDRVVPWQAQRSIVVWRGQRAAKSRALWLGTVRAAAKQSRRAWVPPVAEAVDLRGLTTLAVTTRASGGVVLVLDAEAPLPLADVALPTCGEVVVVVGPEGGIAQPELDALTAAGALAARLGPHVLRTSTAGPVALALLAQRLGRW